MPTRRRATSAAKVALRHPAGKKGVRIDREIDALLRPAILRALRHLSPMTRPALSAAVRAELVARKTAFSGSLAWYLEWIRLDLEARRLVVRVRGRSPVAFRLGRKRS